MVTELVDVSGFAVHLEVGQHFSQGRLRQSFTVNSRVADVAVLGFLIDSLERLADGLRSGGVDNVGGVALPGGLVGLFNLCDVSRSN